ncbi:hypothetical protein Agub_g12986, partial [Astrephomene gubernaculifera]
VYDGTCSTSLGHLNLNPTESLAHLPATMQRVVIKPFRSAGPASCARVLNLNRRPIYFVPRAQATDNEEQKASLSSVDGEKLSSDESSRLSALRRQQQVDLAKDTNPIQGALEEAQLITWPKPQKAALDTVLVLFIVVGSGAMLFGMNVLLAELSEWWYHLA